MMERYTKMNNIQKLNESLGIDILSEKKSIPERKENAYSKTFLDNWKRKVSLDPWGYLYHCGVPSGMCSCSFDNYVTSTKIKEAVIGWAHNPIEQLFIKSEQVGCGKTHLAVSSILEIAKNLDSRALYKPKIRFFTYSMLVKETIYFITDKNITDGIGLDWGVKYLIDLDILVLDDLGSEKTSEANVDFLYLVVEGRKSRNKPTIITSNLTPDELTKRYSSKIVSRISGGKTITTSGNDNRVSKTHSRPDYIIREDNKSLVDLTQSFYRSRISTLNLYKQTYDRAVRLNGEREYYGN